MLSELVFNQQDGDVTKSYYARLNNISLEGELAVALFRAQKRSTAAKKYRGRKFTRGAYDVKNWSLGEICRIAKQLNSIGNAIVWGWKRDPNTPGYEWVLYVNLPTGQCSFHSATRLDGPDFTGEWDSRIESRTAICRFCDTIWEPKFANGCPTAQELRDLKCGNFASVLP